jgi:hypothetical protein
VRHFCARSCPKPPLVTVWRHHCGHRREDARKYRTADMNRVTLGTFTAGLSIMLRNADDLSRQAWTLANSLAVGGIDAQGRMRW